jgi:hypothetical protein
VVSFCCCIVDVLKHEKRLMLPPDQWRMESAFTCTSASASTSTLESMSVLSTDMMNARVPFKIQKCSTSTTICTCTSTSTGVT